MSTTLEDELLQAADDEDALYYSKFGWRPEHKARAARLRQRAAWVREVHEIALSDKRAGNVLGAAAEHFISMLTGPIPAAETAPTERTEP